MRFPVSALLLAAAISLVACDSGGVDVAALDDGLLVDLVADGTVVRLETESVHGCFVPVVYRTRVQPAVLVVRIEGLAIVAGPACRALTTSQARVLLPPEPMDGFRVRVEHRGEADLYAVRTGGGGAVLEPIRQQVTRLRPPESSPGIGGG